MSHDDIWSEPIVDHVISIPEPEISGRTRRKPTSLFLSDSEDEDAGIGRRASPPASPPVENDVPRNPDVAKLDALFGGLDDDDDDPFAPQPALDVEKMKRQAAARLAASAPKTAVISSTPYAVGTNSSPTQDKDEGEKGKKTKRVMPKLDEERLLGHDGFPRLIKDYKNFKITGKGHEAADLERLFRIYHAWTHKMYPKFQFRDTVDRVERLCRSRRMGVNLRAWKDEANGTKADVRHEVTLGDGDGDGENDDDAHEAPAREGSSPLSSRPDTPVTRPASAASTAPSVPSSATDMNDDFDMDVDALLREEEEIMREMNRAGNGGTGYKPSNVEDEEAALWAAAGGISDHIPELDSSQKPAGSAAPRHGEADDEEMWDMFDQMENHPSEGVGQKKADLESTRGGSDKATVPNRSFLVASPAASPAASSDQPSIGADWDDMYA